MDGLKHIRDGLPWFVDIGFVFNKEEGGVFSDKIGYGVNVDARFQMSKEAPFYANWVSCIC